MYNFILLMYFKQTEFVRKATKYGSQSSSIQNTSHYKIIRFKLQANGLANFKIASRIKLGARHWAVRIVCVQTRSNGEAQQVNCNVHFIQCTAIQFMTDIDCQIMHGISK